jgi:hypothetical protein
MGNNYYDFHNNEEVYNLGDRPLPELQEYKVGLNIRVYVTLRAATPEQAKGLAWNHLSIQANAPRNLDFTVTDSDIDLALITEGPEIESDEPIVYLDKSGTPFHLLKKEVPLPVGKDRANAITEVNGRWCLGLWTWHDNQLGIFSLGTVDGNKIIYPAPENWRDLVFQAHDLSSGLEMPL